MGWRGCGETHQSIDMKKSPGGACASVTRASGYFASLLLLLLITLLDQGCQTQKASFDTMSTPLVSPVQLTRVDLTNRIDPGFLRPSEAQFTLGPGDKLELEILGDPTSKTTTVVGPDGKIYFNLLPGIDVWGLTLGEARVQLEKGLAKYMREQPQVSLVL